VGNYSLFYWFYWFISFIYFIYILFVFFYIISIILLFFFYIHLIYFLFFILLSSFYKFILYFIILYAFCVLCTLCLNITWTETNKWNIDKESDCLKIYIIMLLKTKLKKVSKKNNNSWIHCIKVLTKLWKQREETRCGKKKTIFFRVTNIWSGSRVDRQKKSISLACRHLQNELNSK